MTNENAKIVNKKCNNCLHFGSPTKEGTLNIYSSKNTIVSTGHCSQLRYNYCT